MITQAWQYMASDENIQGYPNSQKLVSENYLEANGNDRGDRSIEENEILIKLKTL